MVISAQCTSSKKQKNNNKKQKKKKKQQKNKKKKKKQKKNKTKTHTHTHKKTFNFLKRVLTMSDAASLFCLVGMQRSVSDSESAPNTVTKRHEALFGNVPLHGKALPGVCLICENAYSNN